MRVTPDISFPEIYESELKPLSLINWILKQVKLVKESMV